MKSLIENIPQEIISKNIARRLSPKEFNRFSSVSKNIYLYELYKDNYLYFESLNELLDQNEEYNYKIDYIYRYRRVLSFADQ